MGIEQWSAVGALLVTIIGSISSVLLWLSRRHSEISKELNLIHLDMRTIEASWSDRMKNEISELKMELANGPPWLRELMNAQKELLSQALTNSQIAIDVAEQHGREMLAVSTRIDKIENMQEMVLDLIHKQSRD